MNSANGNHIDQNKNYVHQTQFTVHIIRVIFIEMNYITNKAEFR